MRSPRFEQWFADRNGLNLDHVESMWNGSTYANYTYSVELAWDAWCEAINGVAT